MNSFNHYAYGAIGSWLYSAVAGIDSDQARPGYKHILLRPCPGGGLTSARAAYQSVYGRIGSDWRIEKGQFLWSVEVPANTTATVHLPAPDGPAISEIGSGRYEFTSPWRSL